MAIFGILFDLDGTLADSDSIHFQAWQTILGEIHRINPTKSIQIEDW